MRDNVRACRIGTGRSLGEEGIPMGVILGYLLGRRHERPDDVQWAEELDAHADELHGLVDALREAEGEFAGDEDGARQPPHRVDI